MKYLIRVSGPSSRGGGVYDGGSSLAEARRKAKDFLREPLTANEDIAIVKSAPYHKTKNPYEERLVVVEYVQSPPIGGYIQEIHGRGRDVRRVHAATKTGSFVVRLSRSKKNLKRFHDMARAREWAIKQLEIGIPGDWADFYRAAISKEHAKAGSTAYVGSPWTQPFYRLVVNDYGHIVVDNLRNSKPARRAAKRRDPTSAHTAKSLARHIAREYQHTYMSPTQLVRDYGLCLPVARRIYYLVPRAYNALGGKGEAWLEKHIANELRGSP